MDDDNPLQNLVSADSFKDIDILLETQTKRKRIAKLIPFIMFCPYLVLFFMCIAQILVLILICGKNNDPTTCANWWLLRFLLPPVILIVLNLVVMGCFFIYWFITKNGIIADIFE